MLKDDEVLENLDSVNYKIIQKKKGFKVTLDPILLVNFLNIRKNVKILDIGTGTGIMPLLLGEKKEEIEKIVAVEINEEIANMFSRSLELNEINDKIEVFCCDIKDFKENNFDYIISNPPYMKVEEGKVSVEDYRASARHEIKLNLKEFLYNSKRLLKNGGSLNVIYPTKRFFEFMEEAKSLNLNPKRIRLVHTKPEKESELFLIELIKGHKCNCIFEKALIIFNENNEHTEEVKKYYGIK